MLTGTGTDLCTVGTIAVLVEEVVTELEAEAAAGAAEAEEEVGYNNGELIDVKVKARTDCCAYREASLLLATQAVLLATALTSDKEGKGKGKGKDKDRDMDRARDGGEKKV